MRAPRRPAMLAFVLSAVLVAAPVASAAAQAGGAAEPRSPLADAVADAGRLLQEAAAGERAAAPATSRPAATPADRSAMVWPTAGLVTSEFGMRWGRPHKGIDIAAPIGTPVVAPADGVFVGAAWMSGYGLALHLDHGAATSTFYGHLSAVADMQPGQAVRKGDLVAKTGNTGRSTAPHLHFEVRLGPDQHDPRQFIAGQPRPVV